MYENLTVSELRSVARDSSNVNVSGVQISGANKSQLLAWLNNTDFEPEAKPSSNNNNHSNNSAEVLRNFQSAIAPLISGMEQQLDESRVVELINQHKDKATRLEIKVNERPVIDAGIQHKSFADLLRVASCRIPVFLAGPAGSGKTSAAEQVAKVLELRYEAISVGPMTSKSDLLGFIDASGNYHETGLIKCFRDGGVFMIDEIDAGHAGVLTILNMALANCKMSTPIGMLARHKDFICIAGANTYGNGADRQYVGRNQLDAATLDRFAFIAWDYDVELERTFAGASNDAELNWIGSVLCMRSRAADAGLRVVISPRASIYGVQMLRAGLSEKQIKNMLVFKNLDKTAITKLSA